MLTLQLGTYKGFELYPLVFSLPWGHSRKVVAFRRLRRARTHGRRGYSPCRYGPERI